MSRAAKKHCALKSLQQLQPFYTGGSIRLCCDEQTLVAACGEEAKVRRKLCLIPCPGLRDGTSIVHKLHKHLDVYLAGG